MANLGKQQVSSKQKPKLVQKKSVVEQGNFPETVPNVTAATATTDLSDYHEPESGEMIANVMRSHLTPNSTSTATLADNNQLLALKRQDSEGNFSPTNQLKAAPRISLPTAEVVQTKLTIGEPNDRYEQEANRVATSVVRQINLPSGTQGEVVQGKEKEGHGLRKKPQLMVQRQEAIGGGEASTELASAINSAKGSGQPLDAGLQQSMGQAMGADFSGVSVHTNKQSDQLNQSIQAKAFTTEQDVFFRQGAYEPGSREGQELIAHELTHVVQQNGEAVQRKSEASSMTTQISTIGSQNQESVQREIVGNIAKDKGQFQKGIEPYKKLKFSEVQSWLKKAHEHKTKFSTYEEIVIALWPDEECATKAREALEAKKKQEEQERIKRENKAWYDTEYPGNELGTYYRGESDNKAVDRGGYTAREPLTVEEARKEVRRWFGTGGIPFSEHVAWIRKNETLNGKRTLIATGNDKGCMGYGVGGDRYVRQIKIDGLKEIPGSEITEDILGVPLTASKEMKPTLVINADTVEEATVIAVKGVGGDMSGETTFFTTIPLAKTKLIYKGNKDDTTQVVGWLYGPDAIPDANKWS
ncbi:eCIS core domain-containing protein [Nostoc sp. DSM 114161]|jgi:hypothetical protein|uniref:eCIS core domain-containing protein n=1 Tax=Nostoc sp. DSM 114161 TaxID=3440143 RepID=UPI00404572DA